MERRRDDHRTHVREEGEEREKRGEKRI